MGLKEEAPGGYSGKAYTWDIFIRSEGYLDCWIHDYFDGVTLRHEPDGTTVISGCLEDLPEVYGLILQLRDAVIEILYLKVERMQEGS